MIIKKNHEIRFQMSILEIVKKIGFDPINIKCVCVKKNTKSIIYFDPFLNWPENYLPK